MIRTLVATTAVAALMTTGALAASATAPAANNGQNATSSQTNANPAPPPAGMKSADQIKANVQPANSHLASSIIGKAIYNSANSNAKDIGNVNDLVIGNDGKVQSVIVGVGGFLGIGEKDVALQYSQLSWQPRNGNWTLVLPTTADQLKALPAFNRTAFNKAPGSTVVGANNNTVNGAPAPAPAGGMTPAANNTANNNTNGNNKNNAAATDNSQTSSINKNDLKPLNTTAISAKDLIGTTVYGKSNEKIGSIDDVVLNKDGKIDAVVVNVGGFLGIGSKQVAVAMNNLDFLVDKNGNKYLYTHFTESQLKNQPAYDKATYAQNRDKMRMNAQQ